jgi:hypothetical protein
MEGRQKPHMKKHKQIMNDQNYDTRCMLTPLPASDSENFKYFNFAAQAA